MYPRTLNEVIDDFKGRRAGIIKALTQELDQFYQQCDPSDPSPLRLLGFPDQQWQVSPFSPSFSELPEPKQGINHARDAMTKEDWLRMVGLHSQVWLVSLSTYFADKYDFDKAKKERLFTRIIEFEAINDLIDCKARKSPDIEGRGLPEEMVVHVLLGMPVARDLVQCSFVCKMWRRIIEEPNFAISHLNNYNDFNHRDYLVIIEQPRNSGTTITERFVVCRGDTFRQVMKVGSPFPGQIKRYQSSEYEVLGCVNGVMLVIEARMDGCVIDDVALWNPSINRVVSLPISPTRTTFRNYCYSTFGLGLDGNNYKVVAIFYGMYALTHRGYRAARPGTVQVYTLADNCWSSKTGLVDRLPPSWSHGKQVLFKGAIHWTNLGPMITDDKYYLADVDDTYVVAFDVKEEVFKYFKLPAVLLGDRIPTSKFPTVLDGLFAMFYYFDKRCEIWVMGEYGVPDSWSKHYAFSLSIAKVLHFKSSGELLFTSSDRVQLYDVKTNSQKTLVHNNRQQIYSVSTYSESLLLLNGGTVSLQS